MKTLIVILLVYLVISRLRNKAARYQFPRPEVPSPDVPDRRPAEDDLPLPGPWNIPDGREDAPLPGPWQEAKVEAPGEPVEQHRRAPAEPESQPDTGPARGRVKDMEQRRDHEGEEEQLPPRIAAGAGEGESIRCPRPDWAAVKNNRAAIKRPAAHGQLRGRKHRRAGNSLVASLQSKPALAASIVLGEVLGPRGGRRRR